MEREVHSSIDELDAGQWNGLAGTQTPFLRHEFLAALEHGGCVGGETGWTPRYICLRDEQGLAAAVPAFLKSHSWGEFVFDFAWAQAYVRHGLRYYPKLTLAVPFTPAAGARLLVRSDLDAADLTRQLLQSVESTVRSRKLSSAHALFLDEAGREACAQAGWLLRRDCQFHWHNAGYSSFDAYLETFTADKRKKARRERRRVAEAGIRFETRAGGELDAALLERIYDLHRETFLRHGHEPYLTPAFFAKIARTLPGDWFVKLAKQGDETVAMALFFKSADALYGRYWGASAEYHSLHFETCYHQGIEYCIEHGLKRFEPGTQGEHKVSRGFVPALTWSAHFIAAAPFRAAIAEFLAQEARAVEAYAAEVREHLPYRESDA